MFLPYTSVLHFVIELLISSVLDHYICYVVIFMICVCRKCAVKFMPLLFSFSTCRPCLRMWVALEPGRGSTSFWKEDTCFTGTTLMRWATRWVCAAMFVCNAYPFYSLMSFYRLFSQPADGSLSLFGFCSVRPVERECCARPHTFELVETNTLQQEDSQTLKK